MCLSDIYGEMVFLSNLTLFPMFGIPNHRQDVLDSFPSIENVNDEAAEA